MLIKVLYLLSLPRRSQPIPKLAPSKLTTSVRTFREGWPLVSKSAGCGCVSAINAELMNIAVTITSSFFAAAMANLISTHSLSLSLLICDLWSKCNLYVKRAGERERERIGRGRGWESGWWESRNKSWLSYLFSYHSVDESTKHLTIIDL